MVNSRKEEHQKLEGAPGKTPEAIENQLIALAYDEAKRQILAGQASSQVITHFLKRGTEETKLQQMKLEQEAKLAAAKVIQIESMARAEDLFEKAMDAFRGYQPSSDDEIE